MICSVPSRCWEIARERISSSVITPPELRITCASPIESPRIGYGFRRASIQATIATFLAGGSGRSPLSKPSANASLFFRNSSMALISAPPRTWFPSNMLKATRFRYGSRDLRDQVEYAPRPLFVSGQSPRAVYGLGDVRDVSTEPETDLVAEDPESACRATADGAFG